jgi:hypothetical protein
LSAFTLFLTFQASNPFLLYTSYSPLYPLVTQLIVTPIFGATFKVAVFIKYLENALHSFVAHSPHATSRSKGFHQVVKKRDRYVINLLFEPMANNSLKGYV